MTTFSTVAQNEIIKLEEKYWQAMKDTDVETAVMLTHFPCVVSGPKGAQRISEDQYREMMKTHNAYDFSQIKIENPQVDFLSDTTALVSYSVQVNNMTMIDTSMWVKEGGKWLCAYHSEHPLQ